MNQMNQNEKNAKHMLKKTFLAVRDWILDHSKIIMPLVLVVCVIITVFLAVNANQQDALEKEAEIAAAVVEQAEETPSAEEISTPEVALEENAHQDVNNVLKTYYDAQAEGDIETISTLNTYLNDIEKIRVEELSKYIDSYPVLNVYTKPGLTENTYVAYVYSEVKFSDVDKNMPGMQTYYIGKDEGGNFFINDGTYDDAVWSYIKDVTLQDDVVDLNNKVVVEYNELLANDEELNEFIAYLKEKINEDVGEILAEAEQPVQEEETEVASAENGNEQDNTGETETEAQTQVQTTVIKKAKATDVVNIRSSDSETADKLDKAQIGQEFTVLEQKGNGWSKVEYNGKEAYIKSDYLEVISEETVEVEPEEEQNDAVQTNGTVKVLENVRVRTEDNTDSESLGTAKTGTELELIEKQSNGWTKVKYKGHTAYVKSDYVE